ncbi:MAG: response regulator [Gomphosphaeria aponina SAG 52.96 = DSM 107014]|uniref:Response regulator n=1 Tax=Gomphosphaeria aponina SAG 52.96 = DSM 107014 TaxID=1521640 RepID=A0A941JUL3_9CHRO|nr:response regulator [Gomphosphaeria aponina SAG 52.96 = DSM 107014]
MIKILLVDDQELFRKLLQNWLEEEEDFEVLKPASNGQQAIEKVEEFRPDVVLIDIEMPEMDGITATKIIMQRFPDIKVIVLSGYDDDDYVTKALKAGAKGYLLKNNTATAEDIANTIRAVYKGYTRFGPGLFESIITEALVDLEQLRQKFEEVAPTYDQFKEYLGEARQQLEDLTKVEEKFNQRLTKFEGVTNSHLEEFRHEILESKKEGKMTLEKISQAEAKFNQRFQEMESLETELKVLKKQLSDAGFNPNNFTKIERLEEQLQTHIADVNKMNKKFDLMQTFLIINFAFVFIAIFLSLFPFLFQPQDNQFQGMTQPQEIGKLK